jgi:V/A-type H+-transporting ATPase subunit E
MTLNALADDIATAAKKEAKAVVNSAKKEAKRILAEAEHEAQSERDEMISKAERECAQIKTETVASARQSNQKSMLIARRVELDGTKEAVRETVGSARLKSRATLLKSLFEDAKNTADSDMVLRPVSLDRVALERVGSSFVFGDDVDGLGGFVLESKDGSVVLDYRFDGRLEESWIAALPNVTSVLFE